MTLQQIKSYVAIRYIDQITRFKGVSDEQILRTYYFTDQLRGSLVRLLEMVSSGSGAGIIVSERGAGKSHMLALARSLANQPHLISILNDPETITALQKLASEKLPSDGIPTLTMGFNSDQGLNFLKSFPKGTGPENQMRGWLHGDQLDELIERRINSSPRFALFIDGISPLLIHPQRGGAMLEWLQSIIQDAAAGRFCLVAALDKEIVDGENILANQICSLCKIEQISYANFVPFIDQVLFRKTSQQRKALEILYDQLHSRMPHFTGTITEFVQLYPVHPLVLQLSSTIRSYARSFSLFGFITAVAARTMVRRGLSLICLDDLFDSFEFDLRKNPRLTETFAIYDHLFSAIIPSFGHQNSFYAKMLLKGLVLLSMAGRISTTAELADAVMLYDERDPNAFLEVIASIMERLVAADQGIIVATNGAEKSYIFRTFHELAQQRSAVTEKHQPPSTQEPAVHTQPQAELPPEPISIMPASLEPLLVLLVEAAAKISENDLQLDQLLVSAGKRHFKDWPLIFETDEVFRDRAEINIKWRGSLRKGLFKYGNGVEIYLMAKVPLDDAHPICEYDWQITILRASEPTTVLPFLDAPPTLFYWKPAELTDQERLTLKCLLVALSAGSQLFDAEQAKSVTDELEDEIEEIFTRVYLEQGKLISNNGNPIEFNYKSTTLLNTLLTKLLDDPLTARFPQHPKFEELLDPDYVSEMASWMFANNDPTPDQQLYLEEFAQPLQLVSFESGKYRLNLRDKEFPSESPIGQLLQTIENSGATPLSKLRAYQVVRREPYGLQRPALLLILAALAADKLVMLVDEFGEPIHTASGLSPYTELADFSAICSTKATQIQKMSWKDGAKHKTAREVSSDYGDYAILIVDDDPEVLNVMEEATRPLGCRVEKAFDGAEALIKLQKMPIQLVISDLRMPNMNGIELFYEMRANPKLRYIPFVVITSIDNDEEVATALENGVEDYWVKPFRIQEIPVRIKRLFRRRMTASGAYAIAAWPSESVQTDNLTSVPSAGEVAEPIVIQKERREPTEDSKAFFSVTISDTKTMTASIKSLYEKFLDCSRRTTDPASLPKYEVFESLLNSKTERLMKQFNCDKLFFTIEVEDGVTHVYCHVDRVSSYLKKRPKFLLF